MAKRRMMDWVKFGDSVRAMIQSSDDAIKDLAADGSAYGLWLSRRELRAAIKEDKNCAVVGSLMAQAKGTLSHVLGIVIEQAKENGQFPRRMAKRRS